MSFKSYYGHFYSEPRVINLDFCEALNFYMFKKIIFHSLAPFFSTFTNIIHKDSSMSMNTKKAVP